MNQKSFAGWLRVVIGGIAAIGALVYFYILPHYGSEYMIGYIGGEQYLLPWLLFLWGSAIPCYVVLWFGWKLAVSIGKDQSFTMENARILTKICYTAAVDTAYFFVGNLVFLILGASSGLTMLLSLFLIFFGIVVIVVCSTASHLVARAAEIQEENDLMI